MFTVFADQACTTNIYTHKLISHAWAAIPQKLNSRHLSNGQSAKVYTLRSKYTAIYGNCTVNFLYLACLYTQVKSLNLNMHSVLGMLSSGFGHVINISSIMGKFSTGRKTSYSGAKFGLNGMMDSLRCEVCAHTLNL